MRSDKPEQESPSRTTFSHLNSRSFSYSPMFITVLVPHPMNNNCGICMFIYQVLLANSKVGHKLDDDSDEAKIIDIFLNDGNLLYMGGAETISGIV